MRNFSSNTSWTRIVYTVKGGDYELGENDVKMNLMGIRQDSSINHRAIVKVNLCIIIRSKFPSPTGICETNCL